MSAALSMLLRVMLYTVLQADAVIVSPLTARYNGAGATCSD
jgi:hypothetical protein